MGSDRGARALWRGASPIDENLSVSGNTVTWVFEDGLSVDERATLQLVVNVQQAAYPQVTNTVSIDSPAEKKPESILADSETVPVAEDPLAATGGDTAQLLLLLTLALMLMGAGALLYSRQRQRMAAIAAVGDDQQTE